MDDGRFACACPTHYAYPFSRFYSEIDVLDDQWQFLPVPETEIIHHESSNSRPQRFYFLLGHLFSQSNLLIILGAQFGLGIEFGDEHGSFRTDHDGLDCDDLL